MFKKSRSQRLTRRRVEKCLEFTARTEASGRHCSPGLNALRTVAVCRTSWGCRWLCSWTPMPFILPLSWEAYIHFLFWLPCGVMVHLLSSLFSRFYQFIRKLFSCLVVWKGFCLGLWFVYTSQAYPSPGEWNKSLYNLPSRHPSLSHFPHSYSLGIALSEKTSRIKPCFRYSF